ncbi:TPM domain-containing protein [Pseudomonas antarctica]|uniref:TPM domain-containing protein n=1 Tax=Pseudomonas antarctica TaxID=219572 RepID=UPI003F74DA2E
MMAILRQSVLSLVALVAIGLLGTAQADPSPIGVALDQRVIDLTNTLDAAITTRLKNQLAALEQRKGAQVAVLLVPTTGGASIEDYANTVFRAWKLGRKDVDDGILLVVAKEDRKVRIEVGYGLEGTVTDLLAHRIIEEHITPAFRQGDYAGGVQHAVNDLTVLVDGGDLPPQAAPQVNPQIIAVLLALIAGAIGGVLIAAGKLHWRRALLALVAVTVLLAMFGGGADWLLFLLVMPLTILIGGATFGALWLVPAVFYSVVAMLAYLVAVLVASHFVEVNLVRWLAWPFGCALVLALYVGLFFVIRESWKKKPRFFILRVLVVAAVYVGVGMLLGHGYQGWVIAIPAASIVAFIVFVMSISDGSSGSGGGSSSSSSSSRSSSSSFGGGGSSGGGGASGSW